MILKTLRLLQWCCWWWWCDVEVWGPGLPRSLSSWTTQSPWSKVWFHQVVLSHLGDHNGVGSPRTPVYIPENSQQSTPPKVFPKVSQFSCWFLFLSYFTLFIKVQANGLLLRPNATSNSAKQSLSSENVSTPYSQISGISSYDYEDDFTSEDEQSDFSAMTNVSRRTDKSSKIPIKRSSSLRRRPDLMAMGTSGPPTPSPKTSSPKLAPASPSLPPNSPPAPVPEPKPEEGEDLLLLTDPEVCFLSERMQIVDDFASDFNQKQADSDIWSEVTGERPGGCAGGRWTPFYTSRARRH